MAIDRPPRAGPQPDPGNGHSIRRTAVGLLAGIVLGLPPSLAAVQPRLEVLELVGQSQPAIEARLGAPERCRQTYHGVACEYAAQQIDITYIDGKADWILVSGLQQVAFDHRALEHIGLQPAPPLVRNPFRMHWQSHQGLAVVSVYARGAYVDFIHVQAYTPQ